MIAGSRLYSPVSDPPKQTAWRSGCGQERITANLGEIGQYQTSELGVGGSNPSRCAICSARVLGACCFAPQLKCVTPSEVVTTPTRCLSSPVPRHTPVRFARSPTPLPGRPDAAGRARRGRFPAPPPVFRRRAHRERPDRHEMEGPRPAAGGASHGPATATPTGFHASQWE